MQKDKRENPPTKLNPFIAEILKSCVSSIEHMSTAMALHLTIVVVFGILALICIVGGIYAIYRNALSPTKFSIFGASFSTGHVGVAFVGIGLLVAYFSVRAVLRNQRELAALPPDSAHFQAGKNMRKRKR